MFYLDALINSKDRALPSISLYSGGKRNKLHMLKNTQDCISFSPHILKSLKLGWLILIMVGQVAGVTYCHCLCMGKLDLFLMAIRDKLNPLTLQSMNHSFKEHLKQEYESLLVS